jgi:ABC-2 type transport system ATP-binding protein
VAANDLQKLQQVLQQYPGATHLKSDGQYVELFLPPGTANLEDVNRYCFEKGATLNHLRLRKKSLESKFFELTQNAQ